MLTGRAPAKLPPKRNDDDLNRRHDAQPSRLVLAAVLGVVLFLYIPRQLLQGDENVSAGLPPSLRPIHVVTHTDEVYDTELQHIFQSATANITSCQQYGMRQLGILRKRIYQRDESSFLEWLLEETGLLQSSVYPAFYKAGSDTIHVLKKDEGILRHEWVHALHDQYADFPQLFAETQTTDELLALRAIIEGVAVVLSGGAATPLSPRTTIDGNAFHLAYTLAPAWVMRRMQGQPLDAFQLHAESAYEIMFDRARLPALLPPTPLETGEEIACVDRLGVLALLSLMRQANAPSHQTEQVLRSWRSDRLDVVSKSDGQHRVVWSILFDSDRAAEIWRGHVASSIILTDEWNPLLSISVLTTDQRN